MPEFPFFSFTFRQALASANVFNSPTGPTVHRYPPLCLPHFTTSPDSATSRS